MLTCFHFLLSKTINLFVQLILNLVKSVFEPELDQICFEHYLHILPIKQNIFFVNKLLFVIMQSGCHVQKNKK